jgi:hypothetical protein
MAFGNMPSSARTAALGASAATMLMTTMPMAAEILGGVRMLKLVSSPA